MRSSVIKASSIILIEASICLKAKSAVRVSEISTLAKGTKKNKDTARDNIQNGDINNFNLLSVINFDLNKT